MAAMATAIDRYDSIAQLDQINAIPIEEIERRAQPGQYAISGFIGQNETLKQILQQDWRTVQLLGTTHIELAAHLRNIWNQAKGLEKQRFTYCVDSLPGHSLQEYKSAAKENDRFNRNIFLAIGIIVGIGAIIGAYVIHSLFLLALLPAAGCITYAYRQNEQFPAGQELIGQMEEQKGNQEDLFAQDDNQAYVQGWSKRLLLINPLNKLSIIIGQGVIDYIEKYGFYEGGGNQNAYRIDPVKLVAILTGASISELQKRLQPVSK
jgi:hypothetical protein